LPIIHKIDILYKNYYKLKNKIDKINRYGIYSKSENLILEIYEISIETAISSKDKKYSLLQTLRIKTEIIKKLIRLMSEIEIINSKQYLSLENDLIEISKMANGWQKYTINKEL
jgi:hypothetical protein